MGAAVVASALSVISCACSAQRLHIEPSVDATVTVSDNIDLAPSGSRRSDVVMQITPTFEIEEKSAHTSLSGSIGAAMIQYARTGGGDVLPLVSLHGNAELLDKLLYVDSAIEVTPSYFSPFGAQPTNLSNRTPNRFTAQTYRVSPYVKRDLEGGLHYELRDDNIWTSASGTPVVTDRAFANDLSGRVMRDPAPLGWSVDYTRNDIKFVDQIGTLLNEAVRGYGLWQPDRQWQVSAGLGYENERFPLNSDSGAIYGIRGIWRPNDRMTFDAGWEHRFFGGSYHVQFDNRTPLSVWTLRAARDITTSPQQLGVLPPGSDVSLLLNQLFGSRIADPLQRQAAVNAFISDRGLPSTLSGPLVLYNQQVSLQQSLLGTVGLLGSRNTVFVTVYRVRNEPLPSAIAQAGLVDVLANATQTGASAVWTLKLTSLYTLTTISDWESTTGNGDARQKSNQYTLSSVLEAPLSPVTKIYGGARYQRFLSDAASDYREAAAFIGIKHTFR